MRVLHPVKLDLPHQSAGAANPGNLVSAEGGDVSGAAGVLMLHQEEQQAQAHHSNPNHHSDVHACLVEARRKIRSERFSALSYSQQSGQGSRNEDSTHPLEALGALDVNQKGHLSHAY